MRFNRIRYIYSSQYLLLWILPRTSSFPITVSGADVARCRLFSGRIEHSVF